MGKKKRKKKKMMMMIYYFIPFYSFEKISVHSGLGGKVSYLPMSSTSRSNTFAIHSPLERTFTYGASQALLTVRFSSI